MSRVLRLLGVCFLQFLPDHAPDERVARLREFTSGDGPRLQVLITRPADLPHQSAGIFRQAATPCNRGLIIGFPSSLHDLRTPLLKVSSTASVNWSVITMEGTIHDRQEATFYMDMRRGLISDENDYRLRGEIGILQDIYVITSELETGTTSPMNRYLWSVLEIPVTQYRCFFLQSTGARLDSLSLSYST